MTMLEKAEDLARRRPVWVALSDLFLDTELQEYHFLHTARILAESGYTDDDVHAILFREVYPVCIPNLHDVAGQWAGFNAAWLEDRILSHSAKPLRTPFVPPPDFWMIEKEWQRVLELLPEARSKIAVTSDVLRRPSGAGDEPD